MEYIELLEHKDLQKFLDFIGFGANPSWVTPNTGKEFKVTLEDDFFHWGFNIFKDWSSKIAELDTEELRFELVGLADSDLEEDRIYHPVIIFNVKKKDDV